MELDITIKNAEEKLTILSQDEKARRLYKFRENSAHDCANLIPTGIEKGIERGIEQGREEGVLIACKKNAMAMKVEGIQLSLIAKITGLSLNEIEAL